MASCLAAIVLAGADAQDADVPSSRAAAERWQHLALEHAADSVTADAKLARKIDHLGRDGRELVSVSSLQRAGLTLKADGSHMWDIRTSTQAKMVSGSAYGKTLPPGKYRVHTTGAGLKSNEVEIAIEK